MLVTTPQGGSINGISCTLDPPGSGAAYNMTDQGTGTTFPVNIQGEHTNLSVTIEGWVVSDIENEDILSLAGDIRLRHDTDVLLFGNDVPFGEIVDLIHGSSTGSGDTQSGYIKSINRFSTKDNLGGLLELKVASVSMIDSIPEPVKNVIHQNVVFKTGYAWTTWKVRPFDTGIRSRSRESQEGPYKEYSLPFLIPKDLSDMAQMLKTAESDLFVILVKDANLKTKLIGSLDAPLKFRFDHESGTSQRALNHYACEFYSESPDVSYFFEGNAPTNPPGFSAPALVKKGDGTVLAALQPGESFIITSGFSYGFRIE